MTPWSLVFTSHARGRLFGRGVTVEEVRHVLAAGEVIEEYPEDTSHPSRLVLGWSGVRPRHVVAADDPVERLTIIITVYEPSPDLWEGPEFRRRWRAP